MSIIRGIVTLASLVGAFVGFGIAIAATIALGPLFFVPYLLIYLWLRASGGTPKQLRKAFASEPQIEMVEYTPDPDLWKPVEIAPVTRSPIHDEIDALLARVRAREESSIFDGGVAPTLPSSLD